LAQGPGGVAGEAARLVAEQPALAEPRVAEDHGAGEPGGGVLAPGERRGRSRAFVAAVPLGAVLRAGASRGVGAAFILDPGSAGPLALLGPPAVPGGTVLDNPDHLADGVERTFPSLAEVRGKVGRQPGGLIGQRVEVAEHLLDRRSGPDDWDPLPHGADNIIDLLPVGGPDLVADRLQQHGQGRSAPIELAKVVQRPDQV
jgi:hypothetical protein